MKNMIAALILAAAAATPAMAQEVIESGLPTHLSATTTYSSAGYDAYASSPRIVTGSVVQQPAYADPDPNVRLQLQNESALSDR